jgi:hypothetical protein
MADIVASNSSTAALGAGAAFTGTGFDASEYSELGVSVKTDQPSTVYIEQSSNNTNWDHSQSYEMTSTRTPSLAFQARIDRVARFMRVRVVCGSTAQSMLRLQTVGHRHLAASNATGGGTISRTYDLDEAGGQVYAGAARLHGFVASNSAGAAAYLKLYDIGFGSLAVGTTTPVMTILLPAGAVVTFQPPLGMQFATGICMAATLLGTDADATAPGATIIFNATYTAA